MNGWLRWLLYLPEQASSIARDIDYLHYFVIITTMAGAAAVAALTLIFIVRYREGAGREHRPAPDTRPHHTTGGLPVWAELGVFAGLLGLFLLWWVIGFGQYTKIAEPPADAMPIYVVGKQWMWDFAYPDGTGSNGILFVPAGKPIKLVMTSRDVIHSFYVPDFRLKRDVLPGRTTVMWFEAPQPGRHQILCAEYCGAGHSTMRGEVVVLAPSEWEHRLEDFESIHVAGPDFERPYVEGSSRPREFLTLAAAGERVAAQKGCMRCHTPDGTPHLGPTWAGLYGAVIPLSDGTTVLADETYLTSSMMDPAAQLHAGFPPIMPSYQGLLSAADVGAIVEYIRALRDAPRHDGQQPIPAATGNVPIITPLRGDTVPKPGPARSEGGGP